MGSWGLLEALKKTGWPPIEVTLGQTPKDCTCYHSEGKGRIRTRYVLGQRPKESSNEEPLGAGLQTIYTTVHKWLCEAVHRAMYCA